MRSLTHFVPPVVLASVLATGCYSSNESGDGPDGGPATHDAGISDRDGGGAFDGGGARDASLPRDAGLLCPAVRAEFACFGSMAVYADQPSVLPLSFDTCACCPTTECIADVDPAGRVLRLTTTYCDDDDCDCVVCNTPTARCELPPLAAGTWAVEVNGEPAFELSAVGPSMPVPLPGCVDFASGDGCTPRTDVLRAPARHIDRACVRPVGDRDERWEITLVDECGGCRRRGPCTARVVERLTHDLPPGYDIHVEDGAYYGACDGACPDVCTTTERTCALPELPDGLHRVFVENGPVVTFETGGPRIQVCSGREP